MKLNAFAMKAVKLLLPCLLMSGALFAQEPKEHELPTNMVQNPSFEELGKKMPCKWVMKARKFAELVPGWWAPTETHPDLFSTKVETNCWCHPEKHSKGKQLPRTGSQMVGLKTYGKGGTPTFWHEYIQTSLKTPLQKDKNYYVEFWVQRAVLSRRSSNNIGVVFTDDIMKTGDRLPLYIPTAMKEEKVVQTDDNQWVKISAVITADESYSHMIIGNFCPDTETTTTKYEEGKNGAYYYIDDVTVRPATSKEKVTVQPTQCPFPAPLSEIPAVTSTTEHDLPEIRYEAEKTIILRNVLFETGKAELLPESKKELNKLADILYDYPNMEIEIRGHTDNVGEDAANLALSDARAHSVMEYLISKEKSAKKRISAKGYGETIPIAGNDSDEGRSLNRRVEFHVTKR